LDLLETFVRLVDNKGDAAETARQLGINQPSMSKRLRYLQKHGRVLENPWIERVGKTWVLTEIGKKTLPAVRDLIARYRQLQEFREGWSGTQPDISLACGQLAAETYVAEAVREFYRRFSQLRLRVSTLPAGERVERVASGAIDLAVVSLSEEAVRTIARRELYSEPLFDERYLIVAGSRKTAWLSEFERLPKSRAPLDALQKFPLILPPPGSTWRRRLDEALQKHELLDRIDLRFELGSWAAAVPYVREGLAAAVLRARAVTKSETLLVRGIDPAALPPAANRLVCRRGSGSKERDLSPRGEEFYALLKHAAHSDR
jgi:DNA-binding transcriptional LysR family regulator